MIESLYLFGGTILGWILKLLQDRWSHNRLYDHRFRLEKEYERYCDLWDKLFELQRAVSQLVARASSTDVVRHDEHVLQFFNVFQAVVRKGEPFMSKSVYGPARDIVRIVRDIRGNVGEQEVLSERRTEKLDMQIDEKIADEIFQLEKANLAAFKDVERLFQDVSQAIRVRVMP